MKKTPNLPRKLVMALALPGIVYVLMCAAAWGFQERLVFHPRAGLRATPAKFDLPYEDVWLTSADGIRIHGWYVAAPTPGSSGRTVLFLHGNGANISYRLRTLRTLHRLGHAVLAIDYRGFGQSEGTLSVAGTVADAAAAWTYLLDGRGLNPGDITVYGRSLGGGVASALVAGLDAPVPRLVLESTFTRLSDVGRARYPWLPVGWLLRHDLDSLAALDRRAGAVLVAHSPDDRRIPFHMGQALLAASGDGGRFYTLNGSHNRAFLASGKAYYAALDAFIRSAD